MIQDINFKNHYLAEENKIIINKDDEIDKETNQYPSATKSLWLGKGDSIENYIEVDEPEEKSKN